MTDLTESPDIHAPGLDQPSLRRPLPFNPFGPVPSTRPGVVRESPPQDAVERAAALRWRGPQVVLAAALLLAGTAACARPTAAPPIAVPAAMSQEGRPAHDSPARSGRSPTPVAPSVPTQASGGLPIDDPCELVSADTLQQVDVTTPPTVTAASNGARVCGFQSADFGMALAVHSGLSLAQFEAEPGSIRRTTIGAHPAAERTDSTGTCTISIGVGATARVDIVVAPFSGGDPCPVVAHIAQLVEPRIP